MENKKVLVHGDEIFATGVFLVRDNTVDGGWKVKSFEDDSYHNGAIVEFEEGVGYYIETDSPFDE